MKGKEGRPCYIFLQYFYGISTNSLLFHSDGGRERGKTDGTKKNRHLLGKLEDVEDKFFHLDSVGFVGVDLLASRVHVWDFLLSHMVL